MLCWKDAVCIAGDINPNIILTKEREHLEKIEFAISLGKTVSGASTALSEKEVNALIAAGLEDSHVPKNLEELIEDIRHGLAMLLTPRTTKFGVEEFKKLAELINDRKLDTRLLCFCTDDVWAHELDHQGHIDQRIRIAIAQG